MKRVVIITLVSLALLPLGLIGIVAISINLPVVHRFALARVNNAIPGTVSFKSLRISLFDFRAELTECLLKGPDDQELAGIKRLVVDISPMALFRRELNIEELELDVPWVLLDADSSGRLSIAGAFSSDTSGRRDTIPDSELKPIAKPFYFTLHRLKLTKGELRYTDNTDSLSISAYGIAIRGAGETKTISADIDLSIDSALIDRSNDSIQIFDLALVSRMRKMDIDTVALRFRTAESTVSLSGTATSLNKEPSVTIDLTADFSLEEVRAFTSIKDPLNGSGILDLTIDGEIANPAISLSLEYSGGSAWGYPVDYLTLTANIKNRVANISHLGIGLTGGAIDIEGTIDASEMFVNGFLQPPSTVNNLSYDLQIAASDIHPGKLFPPLSGTASATISLDGRGVMPESLDVLLGISADIDDFRMDTSSKPLDVNLVCSSSVAKGVVWVHSLKAYHGASELSASGAFTFSTGVVDAALEISAPRLLELLALAGIDSATGSLALSARVEGNVKHPQVDITCDAKDVSIPGVRIGDIALSASLDKNGMATLSGLRLTNQTSRIILSGQAQALRSGALVPVDQIALDLSLESRNLELAHFVNSISGTASIDIEIDGTIKALQGHARIEIDKLLAAGQTVESIRLDALLDNERIHFQPLLVSVTQGQDLTATGWISMKDSFDLTLSTPGIQLQSIAALAAADQLNGLVSLIVSAGGTFSQPEASGDVRIANIELGTLPQDDIALHISLHNRQLDLFGIVAGDIQAEYNLDTKKYNANLVFSDLLLTPWLTMAGKNLNGTLTANVHVAGTAQKEPSIEASVHIAQLELGYEDKRLVEIYDLKANLDAQHYEIPEFKITILNEGSLRGMAQGSLKGPHSAELSGSIPLAVIAYFYPDLADIDGTVDINASLSGTQENPDLSAEIRLKDIAMTIPGLTQKLHSLNGRIVANPTSITIESLQGRVDAGALRVDGYVELKNMAPSNLDMSIKLDAVPIGIPDMMDMVINANVRVSGTPDTSLAIGDIVLLDGVYYRDVDLNPLGAIGQRRRRIQPPPVDNTTPYLKNMRFDIAVKAQSDFKVDNNMALLAITPDLHLMGSLNTPALNGRAEVREGTINYNKRVFTVERGVIDFVNPYAIEPEIDIQGSVPIRSYLIRIVISGTPDNLVFRLTSDESSLEDRDLLSLLILGKTNAELQSRLQPGGAFGGQTNEQLLASLVSSTFGEDIRKSAGLDVFEIETGKDGDEESERIAITLGKQISRQLGTKYSVETDDGIIVQRVTAEYRILQNLLLAGFQDTQGIFGGEVRLTWERR